MMKTLRKPALNEAIRNYVKQYILDQGLNPGDPLPPEGQLAQELGVARSSVREAVKALQSLGIVEVRRGHGIYVREYNFDPIVEMFSYGMRFDTATLAKLIQVRIWLEAAVVEDAVSQISPEDVVLLESVIEAWEERVEAGEPDSDLDEQFHRILYSALDNDLLIKLFEVFWIAFENLDIEAIRRSDPAVELKDHQAILQAVRDRNASLARQCLLQSFTRIQDRIRRYVDSV